MKVFKRSIWVLLSVFFIVVFIITLIAKPIMMESEGWINSYFGINPYEVVVDPDDDSDSEYFKSKFVEKNEDGTVKYTTEENGYKHQVYDHQAMRDNSHEVSNRAATEGAVLLWNDTVGGAPALPLGNNAKVGLFSTLALPALKQDDGYFYHGGGSGRVYKPFSISIKEAFENESLVVNETLWNAYNKIKNADPAKYYWGFPRGLYESGDYVTTSDETLLDNNYREAYHREISWSELSAEVNLPVTLAGDSAVMIISRYAGENCDTDFETPAATDHHFSAKYDDPVSIDGNYLDLYEAESEILNELGKLKAAGVVKKIVVLLNTGNAMAFKHLANDYDIDACMWVGYGGDTSFRAIAELLSGKVNPSGRLTDTYVYDLESAPAMENFGDFTFTESTGVPDFYYYGYTQNNKYIVYQEGIYVGYRYYETRYEDSIIGGRGADSNKGAKMSDKWNYGKEVAYPFGHGLSYTSFEYSDYSVDNDGDDYKVSVTVKNTGSVAGKEVVQAYLQKPYTEYDKQNGIEKSAVELVGFAKTDKLAPGATERVTITVPEYEFKTYDSYNKKTYILEKGDYYLAVGQNAHDALNNILAGKGYKKADGMDADGKSEFAYKAEVRRDDFEKYAESKYTGKAVTNRFDDADLNLYKPTSDQKVKYLSRSDWAGTYPSPVTLTCTNAQMISDMQYGGTTVVDGKLTVTGKGEVPITETVTSEYGTLKLANLIGLDYDNPLYEDLLNQMSFEEMYKMITYGSEIISGAASVAAPGYKSKDGPQGVKQGNTNFPTGALYRQCAFAVTSVLAATFNQPLAQEYGEAFGYEMLHVGITGIYGTGVNIHRTAHGGRNWEYMSEDPFLSSKIYAGQSLGLTSVGAVMFTKHFALNDQERNRYGVTVWANEQTIREVYLKAFEYGVTEGKTNGIMSSFNRIGTIYAGAHKGLITDVLRGEWGFKGIVESDACVGLHMFHKDALLASIIAGQDVMMASEKKFNGVSLDDYKTNVAVTQAMRNIAHRHLYVMANSSAMNGLNKGAEVIYHTPWWQNLVLAAQIVSGILMGLCIGMAIASFVIAYKKQAS